MAEHNIHKLKELIEGHVKKGQTVTSTKITRLIPPGENYGSLMLKVDAILGNGDSPEENIHLVAKCVPEMGFKKPMLLPETVKNEIGYYTEVIPTLQNFQRECGVDQVMDFFPKLYGGRLNLTGDSDEVDNDAVLLLENLNVQGYQNIDRYLGFTLQDIKLVLKDLATLQAVSLGLRLKKPTLFEEKIKKYCGPTDIPPPLPVKLAGFFLSLVEDDDDCKPYLSAYNDLFERGEILCCPKEPTEPFISISHNDMWSNNTMQKFENGKAITNKFIDFQRNSCDTPARDLTFLLWSSCQFDVLKDHVDELIEYYHQHFILNLKSVKCDTERFSFENFLKEMHKIAKEEIMHLTFFITYVVFGKKNEAMKVGMLERRKSEVAEEAKNRLRLLVKYYGKRGWL